MPTICWNKSDQENITKALAVICKGQNPYGKEINIKDLFEYFKYKLDGRYTVDQVLYALGKYTDKFDDIPRPSGIIKILEPAKITYAEYKYSLEQCRLSPMTTKYTHGETVAQYLAEQDNERTTQKVALAELSNEDVKLIEDVS